MSKIRFYIDENVQIEVASQLIQHGIEAISAKSLEKLGDSDANHLKRATEMGYVLCTHDRYFLRMSAKGEKHAGIVFAEQYQSSIGGWVRELRKLHENVSAEAMVGRVEFVNVK